MSFYDAFGFGFGDARQARVELEPGDYPFTTPNHSEEFVRFSFDGGLAIIGRDPNARLQIVKDGEVLYSERNILELFVNESGEDPFEGEVGPAAWSSPRPARDGYLFPDTEYVFRLKAGGAHAVNYIATNDNEVRYATEAADPIPMTFGDVSGVFVPDE